MSRKSDKKHQKSGLIKLIGGRKAVGVFPSQTPAGEETVILVFTRPIERSDFNKDGSVKNPTISCRHKRQLVTRAQISEDAARALRDILDVVFLTLDSQPSTG